MKAAYLVRHERYDARGKLRAEAAAFKRKQDAERQRHRRAGSLAYPVRLPKTVIQQLIAKGHIPAGADNKEIGAAVAKIAIQAINGRIAPALPPETVVEFPPRQPERPKAKGRYRQKKDPGRILTGADKARVAAQIMAEEERRRFAEEERARVDANYKYDPVKERRLRLERLERKKRDRAEAYRAKIAALPPQAPKARAFQPFGKSGISKKGGKPVTNGFGYHKPPKSQADTVKPIKRKPKASDVQRFAKITPSDDSVHTIQATDDEICNYSGEHDGFDIRGWLGEDED